MKRIANFLFATVLILGTSVGAYAACCDGGKCCTDKACCAAHHKK